MYSLRIYNLNQIGFYFKSKFYMGTNWVVLKKLKRRKNFKCEKNRITKYIKYNLVYK